MKFDLHVTKSTITFFVSVFIIISAATYLPISKPDFDIGPLFSSVSLLFGILSGFAISILWGRQERVRDSLNDETGILYSIYYRAASIGTDFQKRLADFIDAYLIPQLDYELSEYETSRKSFVDLYNFVLNYDFKPKDNDSKKRMLELLERNLHNRVITSFHAKAKLVPYLSYSIYILGVILLGLIFSMREVSYVSTVITILLSSTVVLVLLLINDLNEMRLWLNVFLETGINQVFDVIGKKRYYDWWLMNLHYQKPRPGETYRVRRKGKIVEETAPVE
jgi:hypothetical protein